VRGPNHRKSGQTLRRGGRNQEPESTSWLIGGGGKKKKRLFAIDGPLLTHPPPTPPTTPPKTHPHPPDLRKGIFPSGGSGGGNRKGKKGRGKDRCPGKGLRRERTGKGRATPPGKVFWGPQGKGWSKGTCQKGKSRPVADRPGYFKKAPVRNIRKKRPWRGAGQPADKANGETVARGGHQNQGGGTYTEPFADVMA